MKSIERLIDDNEELRRIEKMSDDKTKKKRDAKRISLTQRHELTYIKKIAKEMKDYCEDVIESQKVVKRHKESKHLVVGRRVMNRIKRELKLAKFSIKAVDKLRRI